MLLLEEWSGTRQQRGGGRRATAATEAAQLAPKEGEVETVREGDAVETVAVVYEARAEQKVQEAEGAEERSKVEYRRANRALARMMTKILVQRRQGESLLTEQGEARQRVASRMAEGRAVERCKAGGGFPLGRHQQTRRQ